MFVSFAMIFLVGLAMGGIMKKLKLPGLIGMLLAGILLGPYALNALDGSVLALSPHLRELALVIILARAGLALETEDLKRLGRPAVLMSFIPACFEMLGTILLAPLLFGIDLLDAAILAAVVASASPAVIVPRMIKLMDEKRGTAKGIPQLILAGDSVDDVFNIVVFTALLGLSGGESVQLAQFAAVPVSIATGMLAGTALGFTLSFAFRKINTRATVQTILLLACAMLLVAAEDVIGMYIPFSGLLAVMAAGVTLLKRNAPAAHSVSKKLSKLWIGAEVLLFVLVGASVNIQYAAGAGMKTLLLLLFVLATRAVGIQLCLLKTKLNARERLFCAFTGIPKATVQAAIGGIPLAMRLPCGTLVLSVAVAAILFTAPIGAILLDKSAPKLLTADADLACRDITAPHSDGGERKQMLSGESNIPDDAQ